MRAILSMALLLAAIAIAIAIAIAPATPAAAAWWRAATSRHVTPRHATSALMQAELHLQATLTLAGVVCAEAA